MLPVLHRNVNAVFFQNTKNVLLLQTTIENWTSALAYTAAQITGRERVRSK